MLREEKIRRMKPKLANVLIAGCVIALLLLVRLRLVRKESVHLIDQLASNPNGRRFNKKNTIFHDASNDFQQSDKSSLHLTSPQSTTDIQITIAIISNNRLEPLRRLMRSLSTMVNPRKVHINIKFLLEASSSNQLISLVKNFRWQYGHKTVSKRIEQGGLIKSVSEAWFPASDSEYGLLLEDDLELSPYTIIWIEKMLSKVLSSPITSKSARIVGISLFQPTVTETNKNELTRRKPFLIRNMTNELVGDQDMPFLFQTPCSWGALYFPNAWAAFLKYLQHRLTANNDVNIPDSYTNTWQSSWKKYLFEFMYFKGLFLVYPNFRGGYSLSTNHLEAGEHVSEKMNNSMSQKKYYTVPLLTNESSLRALEDMDVSDFPCFDMFGYPYLENEHLERAINGFADADTPHETHIFIHSVNISLYQHQRSIHHRVMYSEKYYRKIRCNEYLDYYVTGKGLFDSSSVTVMISSMHRSSILLKQIQYYATSRLVSTIIVTCFNFNHPVPRDTIIGHTLVLFIRPLSNSLNDRFLTDHRITTTAVLLIDDNIKIHLDDIEVLYTVWRKYPKYIVGTFPRWFSTGSSNKLLYTPFEFNPRSKIGVEYGLILTKVMLIHSTYLFEYYCGNEDEISNDDHGTMLNTVSSLTNCEDIFMNGIITSNIFHAKESAVLAVRPLNYVGDYGSISTGLRGKNAKSTNDVRSDCLNYVHNIVLKYTKRNLPLQTKVVIPTLDQDGTIRLAVTSNDSYHERINVNCYAKDNYFLSSKYCSWKTNTSMITRTFVWQ